MSIYSSSKHIKISQVVTGLLPEQSLNNIVIMCVQHLVQVGPTILFIFVSTILFSNDEATRLFMAVGTRKICIRTCMFTIVDIPVSTC